MKAFILDAIIKIQDVIGLSDAKAKITSGLGSGGGAAAAKNKATAESLTKQANAANAATTANAKFSKSNKDASQSTRRAAKSIDIGAKSAQGFGDSVFLAGKRYAAFIAATSVAFKALEGISAGTQAVIEFDQALVRIQQVLGTTAAGVSGLQKVILDLSTQTGTSAAEIAGIAQTLAQAGFRDGAEDGRDLTKTLEQLAKVPLAPAFESVAGATEGIIAALNQFKDEGLTTADVLDKLVAVSNNFAASSEDISQGIRRGGSAFQAIGGTLDEFIAAFTTIRQVTRETSSAVGTSLKTISARLADPKIIDFLQTKGIRLIDEGQFIGPFRALERIGQKLGEIKDVQEKVNIAVRLGGRRQVSRFLAIAQNAKTANKVLETSKGSSRAFSETTEKGLDAVAVQLRILAAEARKLAIELGPDLFLPAIELFTLLTRGALEFGNAIKPLLPLVAAFGTGLAGLAAVRVTSAFIGPKLGALSGAAAARQTAGGAGIGGLPFSRGVAGKMQRGVAGAGAFLGKSQIAQLGVLTVLTSLTSGLTKAADGTETLSSETIKLTGLFIGLGSVLSGLTISQLGTKVFPTVAGGLGGGKLGGALATGALAGTVALAAGIFSAKEQVEATANKIVDAAVKSVSEIEINPQDVRKGDTEVIGDAVSKFNEKLAETASSFADSFDPRAIGITSGERFSRVLSGVGKNIANIFTGDFEGIGKRGGVSSRDINEQISRVLDGNKTLIDNIFKSIAEEIVRTDTQFIAGSGKDVLKRSLVRGGSTESEAEEVSSRLISLSGGVQEVNRAIIKSITAIDREVKARQNLSRLSEAIIPRALTGQLISFSKGIAAVNERIGTSASSFDAQIRNLEQIAPSDLSAVFSDKALLKGISEGAFEGIFKQTPEVKDFVLTIRELEGVVDSFIENVSSRGGRISSADDLGSEVESFLDRSTNIPTGIKDALRGILSDIENEFDVLPDGLSEAMDPEGLRELINNRLVNLKSSQAEGIFDGLTTFIDASIANFQKSLQSRALIRQAELDTAIGPTGRSRVLGESLGRVGISTRGLVSAGGTREEREERIAGAITVSNAETLADKFSELSSSVSKARDDLSKGDFGEEGFESALSELKNLEEEFVDVKTAIVAFKSAIEAARQSEARLIRIDEAEAAALRRLEIGSAANTPREFVKAVGLDFRKGTAQEEKAQVKFASKELRIQESQELQNALGISADKFDAILGEFAQANLESIREIAERNREEVNTTQIFRDAVSEFRLGIQEFNSKLSQREALVPAVVERPTGILGINQRDVDARREIAQVERELSLPEDRSLQKEIVAGTPFVDTEQFQTMIKELSTATEDQAKAIRESISAFVEFDESVGQIKEFFNVQSVEETRSRETGRAKEKDADEQKISIETDNTVSIDLGGIDDDIAAKLRPLFIESSNEVTRAILASALRSIAGQTDADLQIVFNNAADGLA